MRIPVQAALVTVVITLTGVASAHAAFVQSVAPAFGKLTVGWTQERITQSAPGFVRPPPHHIVREPTVAEINERRHLRQGERRGPNDKPPAHPEEIKMPTP